MQCHRNMDSSQKPLGPEKLSTLCRSLQSPDPRGAQSVCCSKRTDRVGHSWVQTVAQKNSRCPLTAFSSFSILYLMILHSRSGEFQWIPLQAADQGIQYRPRWLLEAWIPVFLRPASSSPCVFAYNHRTFRRARRSASSWSNRRQGLRVHSSPPRHHVPICRLHRAVGYEGPNIILLCLSLPSPSQKDTKGCPGPSHPNSSC